MSVVATVVVLQYHHHDPNGGNMPKWVSLEHIIISIHHTFQLLLWPKWPLSWILHSVVWAFPNLSLSSSAPPGFPPSVGGTCAVVCQAAYFKIRKYKKKKKKVSDFLGCESGSASVSLTLQPQCFSKDSRDVGGFDLTLSSFQVPCFLFSAFRKMQKPPIYKRVSSI